MSRTRFSPNSSSSPAVTLNAPWKTPTSSPMRKTRSSRLHLLAQRLVQRLAVAHHRHQSAPSSSSGSAGPARPRRRRARRACAGAPARRPRRRRPRPPRPARAASRAPTSRSSSPRCTSGERSSTEYQPRHLVAEHVDVVVERLERRGTGARRRTRPPRRRSRSPPRRAPRRPPRSSTPSSTSRLAKAAIGSRSRHSSTSSLVRYSSGSAIEWPRKR